MHNTPSIAFIADRRAAKSRARVWAWRLQSAPSNAPAAALLCKPSRGTVRALFYAFRISQQISRNAAYALSMNTTILRSGVGALTLGAVLFSSMVMPAKADTNTTNDILYGAAAAAAALLTLYNVEHK